MHSVMQFHEYANLFPMMGADDYAALLDSMRVAGYYQNLPVVTYQGKILDGRNRYKAARELGIDPPTEAYTGDDPLRYVLVHNLARRHLNETQRAIVAAKLANIQNGEVGNGRRSANLQTYKPNAPASVPTQPAKVTQPQAAQMLNVSPRTVAAVKAVERAAPDLLEKMESGAMTAHAAEKEVKARARTQARAELAASAASVKPSDRWHVYTGDIRTWQAPRQYDYIITDPPYPREYLPLYEVLAARAVEWLKPGGLLVAMSAHYYLPELCAMLGKHLEFYWIGAYMVQGESAGVFQRHIIPQWKPLLIYWKPGDKRTGKQFADVFTSPANDKDNHKWGQSVGGMLDIVRNICNSGEAILDPFCGAGTTGIAAVTHGCFFDGLEIDPKNTDISRARIAEVYDGLAR